MADFTPFHGRFVGGKGALRRDVADELGAGLDEDDDVVLHLEYISCFARACDALPHQRRILFPIELDTARAANLLDRTHVLGVGHHFPLPPYFVRVDDSKTGRRRYQP